MTKITWKPGTMLSPLPPALITSGTVEKPNVMTVAWTGIISSEPAMTYVSIRPSRYSHELIKENQEFVINIPTLALVTATDFCGVKSGRDMDKFKEMNLTAEACTQVAAPQIAESPLSLECKVKSITNYGTHDMFLAEIVAVNVDDKYIDENGALNLEKAGLLAFSHGHYYTLGRELGSFGFSVNKAKLKLMKKMENIEVTVKATKLMEDSDKPKHKKVERDYNGAPFSKVKNDRPRSYGDGERRAPRRDDEDGGERRAPRRDGEGSGERRPFNRDGGGERRAPRRDGEGSGERSPFNRDGGGERRAPRRDGEGSGERRPFNRDGGGERRAPRRDGEGSGERRPFNRDGGGERRAPRRDGEGSGERRPFNRDGGGERRSPSRSGGGDRRGPSRSSGGERRSPRK